MKLNKTEKVIGINVTVPHFGAIDSAFEPLQYCLTPKVCGEKGKGQDSEGNDHSSS